MTPTRPNLSEGVLFTDFYQLTMAQLYFRAGLQDRRAQFDHFFRSYPDYGTHKAGYCVNAGLEWLLEWIDGARFGDAEIERLAERKGRTGRPTFHREFLDWLRENGHFGAMDLWAVPEGRVIHPDEPIAIAQGPLVMAQLLESALLNILNYQTLIATKASRVKSAGRGRPLLEFGMRRGHASGVNAGIRGALIGGADFSSSVGVSCELGFPPKGTHAHSMVQAFMALGEGELGAFRAYADVYPDDCLLLVDTIDTLESGVPNAIKVFEELRESGHKPVGVRLDSGDLANLSVRTAKMLDEAGFGDTSIVLSNQLDELTLWQILSQIEVEAPRAGLDADRLIGRLVYGVGTNLITSAGDAALDGVYKLVGIEKDGEWAPAIKISETPAKTLNPGEKRLWRLYDRRGMATADLVALKDEEPREADELTLRHPVEEGTRRTLRRDDIGEIEPLHERILDVGRRVGEAETIEAMRERRDADLDRLDAGVRRIVNPHVYHVSLSQKLWDLKRRLIDEAR